MCQWLGHAAWSRNNWLHAFPDKPFESLQACVCFEEMQPTHAFHVMQAGCNKRL
jgi:hypothetical protein